MAVTDYKYCGKCGKTVKMTRCEVCKGQGRGTGGTCRSACNENGWFCPTHGKNY